MNGFLNAESVTHNRDEPHVAKACNSFHSLLEFSMVLYFIL